MENPDLVLQETGSRQTYSRLNYVPSGDTLRRDAISSASLWSKSLQMFLNLQTPEKRQRFNWIYSHSVIPCFYVLKILVTFHVGVEVHC